MWYPSWKCQDVLACKWSKWSICALGRGPQGPPKPHIGMGLFGIPTSHGMVMGLFWRIQGKSLNPLIGWSILVATWYKLPSSARRSSTRQLRIDDVPFEEAVTYASDQKEHGADGNLLRSYAPWTYEKLGDVKKHQTTANAAISSAKLLGTHLSGSNVKFGGCMEYIWIASNYKPKILYLYMCICTKYAPYIHGAYAPYIHGAYVANWLDHFWQCQF